MATKAESPKDIRPTIAQLDAILELDKSLREPSTNLNQALRQHKKSRTKPENVKKQLRSMEEFCCNEKMARKSKKLGRMVLTRTGKLIRDYARAILTPHREIRVWPPVFEIVIGATQRTASAYLPKLLAEFTKPYTEGGRPMPFQITVREIDSREEFFDAIAQREIDFGLRGLPVSEDGFRGTSVPSVIQATPFGPAYRLVAISKQPFVTGFSLARDLAKQPVGVLKMNMDEVRSLLAKKSHHLFVPQKNIITCDSFSVLMSFVQNSICTGLAYVPPEMPKLKNLHTAEISDIQSHTRCYVFSNQLLNKELDALKVPKDRARWRAPHYLAELRKVLWNTELQKLALKPTVPEFPFM